MRRISLLLVALTALVGSLVEVPARATSTVYQVGAATRRIDPDATGSPLAPGTEVRQGGFGLGDGTVIPDAVSGPGSLARDEGDHAQARALVIDDGTTPIALVTVETQGMFAAYQRGIPGLIDIARAASERTGGALPASNIVISNDHSHSGPDLIGAWGFVPDNYAKFIGAQIEDAIVEAYTNRVSATIAAGADWTPDLVYNQTCTQALNQGESDTYPNTVCTPTQESIDAWLRVLQARATSDNRVIATMVAYSAHSTENLGRGLNGDWPQFLGDRMAAEFGGVGLAFQGAVGRTQPCRPRCGYTDHSTPGYELPERRDAYPTMLMYHVRRALLGAPPVDGSIAASKRFIRQDVTNPALLALLYGGKTFGTPLARSLDAPWAVGNTVRTVVSAVRVGTLLFLGAPGEAYPNIPAGVSEATNVPPQRLWTLSLSDDQLGYLISPVEAYASILAESAVNDNATFNISPAIGDHVMCAQIQLSAAVGFPAVRPDAHCPAWDAIDSQGDPLGG